ncbi:uncharacterized protein UTRI_10538_B [Ustilago trichophora]|uniref:Uncharacterized protein n=1 Tax=Ustilago trichophora TaxID=86804 RepID=A0A5C3ED33_9BASI|nr:uncharacterized protein UTRI_10538_B [Ustilago trichophora]
MLTLLAKVLFMASLLGQHCVLAAPMDPHWPGGSWPNPYGGWQQPDQPASHSYEQPNTWAERFGIDAGLQSQPGYQHPATLYPSNQYPVNEHFTDYQNQAPYQYHQEEPSGHDWNVAHTAGPSYPSQHYPASQYVPTSQPSAPQELAPSPGPPDEQAFLNSLLEGLAQSQASHSSASGGPPFSPLPQEQNAFVDSLFDNFSPFQASSASHVPSRSPRPHPEQASVDSVLAGLPQSGHVAEEVEHDRFAPVPSGQATSELASSLALSAEKDLELMKRSFLSRERKDWPEPQALSKLRYLDRFGSVIGAHFTVRSDKDQNARDLINRNFFNGHLQWFDTELVPFFGDLARRSPFRHYSRELYIGP